MSNSQTSVKIYLTEETSFTYIVEDVNMWSYLQSKCRLERKFQEEVPLEIHLFEICDTKEADCKKVWRNLRNFLDVHINTFSLNLKQRTDIKNQLIGSINNDTKLLYTVYKICDYLCIPFFEYSEEDNIDDLPLETKRLMILFNSEAYKLFNHKSLTQDLYEYLNKTPLIDTADNIFDFYGKKYSIDFPESDYAYVAGSASLYYYETVELHRLIEEESSGLYSPSRAVTSGLHDSARAVKWSPNDIDIWVTEEVEPYILPFIECNRKKIISMYTKGEIYNFKFKNCSIQIIVLDGNDGNSCKKIFNKLMYFDLPMCQVAYSSFCELCTAQFKRYFLTRETVEANPSIDPKRVEKYIGRGYNIRKSSHVIDYTLGAGNPYMSTNAIMCYTDEQRYFYFDSLFSNIVFTWRRVVIKKVESTDKSDFTGSCVDVYNNKTYTYHCDDHMGMMICGLGEAIIITRNDEYIKAILFI